MCIMRLALIIAAALASTGCGSDCSGQSVPHCPSSSAAECVDGHFVCVPIDNGVGLHQDLAAGAAKDMVPRGD